MAPFACRPEQSRGRRYPEPASALRDAFQRDRDRILHATAFRRLQHKTQVFTAPDGDHVRTRLTHSLEVAQIGRTLARALGLDEDLTEALCLAHDLGHAPFGHAGEEILDAKMAPWGGFDHNEQTLRIVTRLEGRHIGFDGLNLCWETLDGLAKHNGPVSDPGWVLREIDADWPLDLGAWPSLEAQIAALADDVAYDNHDLDDGLRSGLFTLDEVLATPLVAQSWQAVMARTQGIAVSQDRLIAELVRHQIGHMVADILAETRARLAAVRPESVQDIYGAGRALVGFSSAMVGPEKGLKQFLLQKMYRHSNDQATRDSFQHIIGDLFDFFLDDPAKMPGDWGQDAPSAEPLRARHVADFIACMTDRYAQRLHAHSFPDR